MNNTTEIKKFNYYLYGLKKGLPIGLAYLSVSFALGVMLKNGGITPLAGAIMSLTNFTSAGEFAGSKLIMEVASFAEIFLTVLLINLRYALMSTSLSQKIDPKTSFIKRFLMSFAITDEIYALAITEEKEVNLKYMLGLMTLPLSCWTLGTLIGSLGASIFGEKLLIAMSIALYAMFIAIIFPDAKKDYRILIIILIAIALSNIFYYLPIISEIGFGFKVIIVAIITSILGALIFPIQDEKEEESCM